MENLVVGTVLNREDWDNHIFKCEKMHDSKHRGIVGKAIVVSVDNACPQTPFLCYSLYQEVMNLDGDPNGEWLHFCFVAGEAAWILANAEEDMMLLKEKHREQLETERPERMKSLASDLGLDDEEEDPDENLGTVGADGVLRSGN